jgi:ABC-type bacteriocin/lantibiotic exporter with double-glycine peptidase domain
MPSINRVEQKHANGCFIAAMAMASNLSYEKAFYKFEKKKCFKFNYFEYERMTYDADADFRKWAKKFNIIFKPSKNRKISNLKRTAFIILRWSYGGYHCIIWHKPSKRILDPDEGMNYKNLNTNINKRLKFYNKYVAHVYYLYNYGNR